MATYKHLRSSTANKRPTTSIADGQLAINTNTVSPGLFFKDSAGTGIVKVGPVHVGTTAPNSVPATGGSTGNYTGEQWLDTSVSPAQMKVWNGSQWVGIVADELPVSKLQDGAARQLLQTDAAGTGVEWTSNVDVPGTLDVTSTATFDSIAQHPLGTAGAPTITFTGDTNTGIYSPGADQLALSTNGTGRLFIDANGNVGVGTSSLTSGAGRTYLTLGGTTLGSIALKNASNSEVLYIQTGSASVDYYMSAAAYQAFWTNNQERLRITSAGLVGIGTSSIRGTSLLDARGDISFGSNASYYGLLSYDAATGYVETTSSDGGFKWIRASGPVTSMTLDSSGRLGIGTTSPSSRLHIYQTGSTQAGLVETDQSASVINFKSTGQSSGQPQIGCAASDMILNTNGAERARIDSAGRLLVGTSSATKTSTFNVQGNSANSGSEAIVRLQFGSSIPGDGGTTGILVFGDSNEGEGAYIYGARDGGTWSGSSKPSRLVFSTTADGASLPTERMRITNDGAVYIGSGNNGYLLVDRYTATPVTVHRVVNDGTLISFIQGGVEEGTISVSGSTVSYNGAHLSRWSQILGIDPHEKDQRPEILRGTVMSNLDEMCDWIDPESGDAQDNEQLNKTKISDIEGDKNVAGIFQSWDDDDDTWVNDYYLAMTGDFIIRIGAGVTVERGDLLMSAGDGTAKPQDDDIIRSKTIAKVTSTNVSCTYDDGSYCVPCVLMAC